MEDELDTEMTDAPAVVSGGLSTADALQSYRAQQALVEKQIRSNMDRIMEARDNLRAQRVGPSAAERLFAISAALGKPTNTGRFSESMANLGETLGAQERAKREAARENEALAEKYGMQIGNEQLRLLMQGQTGAGQLLRAAQTADAAKAKASRPIFRGTETLKNGMIVAIYEDPTTGKLTKQPVGQGEQQLMPTTMLSGGQPVFRMGEKLFTADGAPVTAIDKPERKLSPTEMALADETGARVNSGKEALISLNRAMQLNPLAFDGSFATFRKTMGALVSSDDPAYVATEELDNTTIGSALSQMKTTFGASPTEGERKIMLEMQGASTKPRAVREKIFQDARAAVQRRLDADAKKLTDIRTGSFGRVQPAAPSTPSKPGKPRILNWKS